jgi:hypothetical protein
MKLFLAIVSTILATLISVDAHAHVCAKHPEAKQGCSWKGGLVLLSADTGLVMVVEGSENAVVLDDEPKKLFDLGIDPDVSVLAGQYLFCPLSPKPFNNTDEYLDHGCIEKFRKVDVVKKSEIKGSKEEFKRRICARVDCSRPEFSKFVR